MLCDLTRDCCVEHGVEARGILPDHVLLRPQPNVPGAAGLGVHHGHLNLRQGRHYRPPLVSSLARLLSLVNC